MRSNAELPAPVRNQLTEPQQDVYRIAYNNSVAAGKSHPTIDGWAAVRLGWNKENGLAKAGFDPSQARDPKGKWTEGGGSEPPSSVGWRERIDKIAKAEGFDSSQIILDEGDYHFTLNGEKRVAGGTYHSDNGTIRLYTKHLRVDSFESVLMHEIMHHKYHTAQAAALNEWNELQAKYPSVSGGYDPSFIRGVDPVRPDGSLQPPYDKEFPIYSAWHEARGQYMASDFAGTDGVTAYSDEYWKAYNSTGMSGDLAINETLAEMHSVKYKTGKLPEHQGYLLLSVRGRDPRTGDWKPKPTQKEIVEGTRRWRKLYRTTNAIHASVKGK